MTLPAAVLVDLDDTLIDTRGAWLAVLADISDAAREELPGLDPATFEARYLDARDDIYRRMLDGELDLAGYRAAHLRAAAAPWGDPSGDLVAHNERLRDGMIGLARLREGAEELLDGLRAADVRIGLLTNGTGAVQRRKIDAVGLESRLDGIGISEELGTSKPAPEAFLGALDLVGAAPRSAVMVGDNLDWDVRGAIAADMAGAVWLNGDASDERTVPARTLRVSSLTEVEAALERLSG